MDVASAKMLPMVAVALLLSGCGKATETIHIRGKVTYRGEPVPVGTIIIDPVRSDEQDKRQRSFVTIRDGQYDTSQGAADTALAPGPVVLVVSGYDGKNKSELMPQGTALFEAYRQKADIRPDMPTIDIEVR